MQKFSRMVPVWEPTKMCDSIADFSLYANYGVRVEFGIFTLLFFFEKQNIYGSGCVQKFAYEVCVYVHPYAIVKMHDR